MTIAPKETNDPNKLQKALNEFIESLKKSNKEFAVT